MREPHTLTLQWTSDDTAFSFDAGTLCLELLTTGGVGDYAAYETLRMPDDLAAWLATCRLGTEDVLISDDDLAVARGLRGAIFDAATATVGGSPLPRAAIAVINESAAPPPLVPALDEGHRTWQRPVTGSQAVSCIARDAVDLFGGPHAGRVRECSAGNCSLLFVDTSRPGQRRWCSMERCGNRAKQRARYRRGHA